MASQTTGNAGYQWRDNEASRRDLGQSFLATSDFVLDSFSFLANGNVQVGADDAAFTATVYESSVITSVGSSISSQTGNYLTQASNPIDGNWLLFDLEENVSLTSGNYYTIMLSWNIASVTDQDQVFNVDTLNNYTDGRLWQYDGGSFSAPGYDMAFTVQAVPEPATMAMGIGLGVLGLALYFRRRK